LQPVLHFHRNTGFNSIAETTAAAAAAAAATLRNKTVTVVSVHGTNNYRLPERELYYRAILTYYKVSNYIDVTDGFTIILT